jgi:DNA invertase Pin-like site-specific DNA recombinase
VKEFSAPISAILVTELSRWSRSTVDLVATLDDLASHGVSVLTLSGLSLDMSTPTGKLTATILASVAEFERDLIRERTKSGLAHAKAQGKTLGRPSGSYSAIWKHYKYIIARHKAGASIRSLAQTFMTSSSTIKRMIDHHKANKPTSPVVD